MGIRFAAGRGSKMVSFPWREKPSARKLIRSVEGIYFDLRRRYPDQDEHWLLANTWRKRYGSTKEAKQKGEAWARFVAYRDTCRFSILEMPKSIRALALFVVAKELGPSEALYYASGFATLTEPIIRSKESHEFLARYKERNPRTWQENQFEDSSPYSLYWFFRDLEFPEECLEPVERVVE